MFERSDAVAIQDGTPVTVVESRDRSSTGSCSTFGKVHVGG